MKKALITGITGFAGSHLADYLLKIGDYELLGTYHSDKSLSNLADKQKIKLHRLNLEEQPGIEDLVKEEKPDIVFHLAALSSPRKSFDDPKGTFLNNVSAQISLTEAVKKYSPEARMLIISSAEVYGLVEKDNLPIDEETPFNPTSPYAVSKLAQDYLGLESFLSDKLNIVRVRPFNHVGPRQAPDFVVSGFAKRIVDIEKGREDKMKVGNLTSKRDFTDVRDMVKAYLLAVEKGKAGEVYNLGSGHSFEISEVLNMMISYSSGKIEIEEDQSLMRPSDNPDLICDCSKFEELTGWKPEIPLQETLKDTLDYWRRID